MLNFLIYNVFFCLVQCDRVVCIYLLQLISRDGHRIFLRRGCTTKEWRSSLVTFVFLQNTSCIRKPQAISAGGGGVGVWGAHSLHPPRRSTPDKSVIMKAIF